MQHIFLSYSHKDKSYMLRVRDDLQSRGIQVWTDEGLRVSTPSWTKAIEAAIEDADCILLVMSKYAKASEWVDKELHYANMHGKRIFAVLARGKETDAIPLTLASSQWKDIRHKKFIEGMKKVAEDIYFYLEEIGAIPQPIARQSRQDLLQKVEEANKSDPDFKYLFSADDKTSSISIIPKHDKALEERPISLDFTVDSETAQQIQKSLETGEELTFNVLELMPKGMPEWMGMSEIAGGQVTILPAVTNESLPLQIQCFDVENVPLFRTPYVQMKLVQKGTKVVVWRGKPVAQPIVYEITMDRSNQTLEFNFSFTFVDRNPIAIQSSFATIDKLKQVTTFHITNLNTEESFTLEQLIDKRVENITENQRKFVDALVTINIDLGVNILVPYEDEYSEKELQTSIYNALETAKILRTGTTSNLPGIPNDAVMIASGSIGFTSQVLAAFEATGKVDWKYDVPDKLIEISTNILGHNIKIGKAYYVFPNSKILNVEELKILLSEAEADDDRNVNTVFDIDREQAYTQFLDWPKSNDQDTENQPEVSNQ